MRSESALKILSKSRWVLARGAFKNALKELDITQREIAIAMGYSPNNPLNAESQLSARLSKSAPIKGITILRAAQYLHMSPYEFAHPTEAYQTQECELAVYECLHDSIDLLSREHAITVAWYDHISNGYPIPFDKYRDAMKSAWRELFADSERLTLEQRVKYFETEEQRLAQIRQIVIRSYTAMTFRARLGKGGEKYAIDASALQTGGHSWQEQRYQSLINADAWDPKTPDFRTIRTFAIAPETLTFDHIENFRQALKRQIRLGIIVKAIIVGVDCRKDFQSDIAIVGDYAIELNDFEGNLEEIQEMTPADLFIHRSESTRFNNIKDKLDWTQDNLSVSAVLRKEEEVDEFLSDFELKHDPSGSNGSK